MAKKNGKKNVAFLSTYPPRGCGLATFTEDLVNEVSLSELVRPCIIAVTAGIEEYDDPRVEYRLHQHERMSYPWAARWANINADLLVIEHEYGIFGGESGEFILDLVNLLEIPFIVTTHTVLESPTSKQKNILRVLGELSVKVVTMAESSAPILTGTYGIAPKKNSGDSAWGSQYERGDEK